MTQRQRAARAAGFTILEILIAIVILVVGITGIVALFPTAIESGNKTVEDSYAAAITQSVIDAISVGLRESKYSYAGTDGRLYYYFILDHDGVMDEPVNTPNVYTASGGSVAPLELSKKDYAVLLPKGPADNTDPAKEPIFTYPIVTNDVDFGWGTNFPGPSDKRAPTDVGKTTPVDDMAAGTTGTGMFRTAFDGTAPPWIRRVFPLGRYRIGTEPPSNPTAWRRAIRKEFLGEQISAGVTTTDTPDNYPVIDPYPQYSYAIAITRAKIDNADASGNPVPDGKITDKDRYSDNLYEVRILIFRNFQQTLGLHTGIQAGTLNIPKQNIPIREFVTLMSI